MSQCVPRWESDVETPPPLLNSPPPTTPQQLPLRHPAPHVPTAGTSERYEVAELTWENDRFSLQGHDVPRVAMPFPKFPSVAEPWNKHHHHGGSGGHGTLEAVVDQATHPQLMDVDPGVDLLAWLGGTHLSSSAADMLVPCGVVAAEGRKQGKGGSAASQGSAALEASGDLSSSLSELLTLSPTSDDGTGVTSFMAKDPLQSFREVLSLFSEGLQPLLQTPEKFQRLEELLGFLMASSHYSLLPPREQRLIFSLSSRLPFIVSLQSNVLKELEAVGAHFRTVETYRVSVASQVTPIGECEAQLSQLRQHSAGIEREIIETELHLACLKRDLAVDQAAIDTARAQLQTAIDLGASLRHGLSDLLNKHSEIKRRKKAAQRSQALVDAEWKQLQDIMS